MRAPLLQIQSNSTGLLVEVTANNWLGCLNSRLLKTYLELHPKVSALARLAKVWAQRAAVQSKESLTSYALVLLVVHYLQNAQYVPVLQ